MAETERVVEHGVLLYYKYVEVPDLAQLLSFYDSNCKSLGLLGRVRIAREGVNVTVGGKLSLLEEHIAAVKSFNFFEGTDFKLASCNSPLDNRIATECGFTSLSIRVVKELVTLSSNPLLKLPTISNAGKHLSAVEFNSVLQNAGSLLENEGSQSKKLVLLDARNIYETRIGKFQTPNVETLDPKIRQYSDLPSWIDDHSEQLRGKSILMYCTGGIRCEMASAYIRSKGAGFDDVFQLYGGIQRYLEYFADGGFFNGKNFVFDHRISVGSSKMDIIGSCLLCGSPFDNYSSRCRCAYCRMLVLVCDSCQKDDMDYVCELCQKHDKEGMLLPSNGRRYEAESTADVSPVVGKKESSPLSHQPTPSSELHSENGVRYPKKLRILCLHGFRQNASNFKGRTASFAKKLKNMVELTYIDAPHEVPFLYRPRSAETSDDSLKSPLQHSHPPSEGCRRKYAWLVAQKSSSTMDRDWQIVDEPFDPLQYQQQTDGFDESLTYLKAVFSVQGPFDGVLGFSQGAAMTALLCRQHEIPDGEISFKFAILCSGFAINSGGLKLGLLQCPSLHIFGNGQGKDRQIGHNVSLELSSHFEPSGRMIIEHESGHIIPTQPEHIDRIKAFLLRFL
ncbi:hypothetical protein Scep_030870 [Stephania cephalantha]|uniref:Rhodanese domain-containing protein n=1 Tax=Stephania cephalantha TaxID=152367 RepID=A0AAP0E848_9MAGN